jgi:hypothetical protein
MAACPVLDFGSLASDTPTTTTSADAGLQQGQNFNRQISIEQSKPLLSQRPDELINFWSVYASMPSVVKKFQNLAVSDDVEVPPTGYAQFVATQTVPAVYELLTRSSALPEPAMGTDDSGAIMVSWSRADKYVAANFGANPETRSFIYFEQGTERASTSLTENNLLDRLRWLLG